MTVVMIMVVMVIVVMVIVVIDSGCPIFSPPQTIDNTSGKLCDIIQSIIILVAHNNIKGQKILIRYT